ncbi:hypothetical protein GCM10022402_05750 [Salinactinospora qingdaonensis]|uniref:Uncharacterized protein n=1 Tax=Salinactinospora qingdaonensis TaxID=702744 RepID=A0ABP7EZB5_9ACTN
MGLADADPKFRKKLAHLDLLPADEAGGIPPLVDRYFLTVFRWFLLHRPPNGEVSTG